MLRGPPGVNLSEPLIDFIHSNYLHFEGGIFWINSSNQQLVNASIAYIEQVRNEYNLKALGHNNKG